MEIYVDATTLIALGEAGRLALLGDFDGQCVISGAVATEVTTQPAAIRMEALLGNDADETVGLAVLQDTDEIPQRHLDTAQEVLDENDINGDTEIVASVLWLQRQGNPVAVVSDDRRVRTVAGDFGATITGTTGVVVRAVHEGMSADEAKDIVRQIDSQGLHLTGELRDTAFELIDDAVADSGG